MPHLAGANTTGEDAPLGAEVQAQTARDTAHSSGNNSLAAHQDRVMLWIMIAAVGVGVLIRCVNPFLYDIRFGHDQAWHVGYLIELFSRRPFPYYVAPYYYLICLLHGLPALPFYLESVIGRSSFLSFGVGLANLDMYIWYMAGLWYVAQAIRMSRRQRLAWVAICALAPVIHRSLNMVRPENLMLPLAMWLIVIGLSWMRELGEKGLSWRSYKLWLFSVACAVFVTQKVTGASLLVGLWLIMLVCDSANLRIKFRGLVALSVLVIVFAALLGGAHRVTSGTWIFQHQADADPEYAHRAPLSFVTSIDPVSMWESPLRDSQKRSMPGILTVDLFGDYWKYGVSHMKWVIPREQEERRARLGLSATLVFVALGLLGMGRTIFWAVKGRGEVRETAIFQLSFIIPVILAYAILGFTAMYLQFNPNKGDLAKWEYMIWCLPFIAMPVSAALERGFPRSVASVLSVLFLWILIVGVAQSTLIF